MTICIPCLNNNKSNEAAIAKAEQRGKEWAKNNNLTSFVMVKMKNGAYSYKAASEDLSNFEPLYTVYL